MRVISGGAEIDGVVRGAALVRNAPASATEWAATAAVADGGDAPWRLVVTAVCGAGGS
jgi:hypothetical protein